jgi:hypothetical protein
VASLTAQLAALRASLPPACAGAGSFLQRTGGAWACVTPVRNLGGGGGTNSFCRADGSGVTCDAPAPGGAASAPPDCHPPGGAWLSYDGSVGGWACVCAAGWSGPSCTVGSGGASSCAADNAPPACAPTGWTGLYRRENNTWACDCAPGVACALATPPPGSGGGGGVPGALAAPPPPPPDANFTSWARASCFAALPDCTAACPPYNGSSTVVDAPYGACASGVGSASVCPSLTAFAPFYCPTTALPALPSPAGYAGAVAHDFAYGSSLENLSIGSPSVCSAACDEQSACVGFTLVAFASGQLRCVLKAAMPAPTPGTCGGVACYSFRRLNVTTTPASNNAAPPPPPDAPALYSMSEPIQIGTCGAQGSYGPSLEQCTAAYAGQPWLPFFTFGAPAGGSVANWQALTLPAGGW